ncbi:pectin lyase-like superfamily protein [Wolffia australiana]
MEYLSYMYFGNLEGGLYSDLMNLVDEQAFMAAWKAACSASGNVRLVVPKGTYLVGPLNFKGPCRKAYSVTVQVKGYLLASKNLASYADYWVQFGWVNRLTLTGGGIFDGQGAYAWPHNTCPKNWNCKLLPTSIKFVSMTNTVVKGITSLNSKFFHIAIVGCKGFHGSGLRISAPAMSPNTDGIHLHQCQDVVIQQSTIATGDDCISIGQGNSGITISGINCGPGHGISVGSLGKYAFEKDVRGLVVKNSILSNTDNGLRIKTWASSPGVLAAANMTFDNIVMNNVANPIIIDQLYCPYASCASAVPSRVRISDIFFKNIRGTSATPVAVMLRCSHGSPCKNVRLQDVHLDHVGGKRSSSTCTNVNAIFSGTQIPPPCRGGV